MQLPKIFHRFKRTPPEDILYRLALVLLPHHVLVAVWGIGANGKPFVAGTGKEEVKNLEHLPEAAGTAIDAAVEEAGHDVEDVLFGVMDVWLHEGEIDKAYADRLRAASETLEIRPVAFVSITQAIIHALKMHESAPPTVILVGVDGEEVSVSVVQTGRIIGSAGEKVHERMGLAIESAIRLLGVKDHLPPRILLYGGVDLREVREDLLAYPWVQRLPFLHFPKINILHDQAVIDAVVEAGATEYTKAESAQENARTKQSVYTRRAKAPLKDETHAFGFVVGKDITEAEEEEKPRKEEEKVEPRTAVPSSHVAGSGGKDNSSYAQATSDDDEVISTRRSFRLPHLSLPSFSLPMPSMSRLALMLFGGAFLFIGLIMSVILAFWVFPRADIILTVKTVRLEREAAIVADPSADQSDFESGRIAAKRLTLTQTRSKGTSTTGEKTVGDPARGRITIFNKSTVERTLEAGTQLTAQGSGLTFLLKDEVRVASNSSTTGDDEVEIITPGTATATIEAEEIGEEGNLAEGTTFSIAGFSLDVVKGKAQEALTGGSSRPAAIVTREDHERLEAELLEAIRAAAIQELRGRLSPEEELLEQAVQQTITSRSFDYDIGEEASVVTATIEATTVATVYDRKDLEAILTRSVEDAVPDGYELVQEETRTNVDVSSVDEEGVLTFTAYFEAHLLPIVDQEEIALAIAGKRLSTAEAYLRNFPDVIDVSMTVWPEFPDVIATLPRRIERITIERKR